MALPSAQLGGLASLNVPSYVPTQVVQAKEPLWKKALAQVLMSTAASAGQGVAQNATARDYAPDGQKAGFWDKLVSGPKTGEREHLQSAAHEQRLEQIGADIVGRLTGQQLELGDRATGDLNSTNARLEEQGINNESALRRDFQDRQARIEENRQNKMFTADENAANREFQGRQDTDRNALLREQTREIAGKNSQAELLLQQLKDSQTAAAEKNAPKPESKGFLKSPMVQGVSRANDAVRDTIMGFLRPNQFSQDFSAPSEPSPTPSATPASASPSVGTDISRMVDQTGHALVTDNVPNSAMVDPREILIRMSQERETMARQTPEAQQATLQRIEQLRQMLARTRQ